MKTAVICVLHNNAKTLKKTWDGWVAASQGGVDWYFLDNASTDDTVEVFNALRVSNPLPGCRRIVCSRENLFFGKGVNALIDSVSESYDGYMLLNPDIILHPNFFDDAISSILLHGLDLGSWAPALRGEDGMCDGNAGPEPSCETEFREWTGIACIAGGGRFFRPHIPADKKRLRQEKHAWLGAGLLYIPAEVWKKTDGFDTAYDMYMEDIDLGMRIRSLGYANIRDAKVEAIHIGQASSVSSLFRFEHMYRSALHLYRTYMPLYGIMVRPIMLMRRVIEYIRHANTPHT